MSAFIGEHGCKMDAKGRIMLPAGLKKQLSPEANQTFVATRGFDKYVSLYPLDEWKVLAARVNKLNPFVKKNQMFIRMFTSGANEVEIDAAGRVLLPKMLIEYAGLKADVVLSAFGNKIEVWDKVKYEEAINLESDDFADLAEEVMGNISDEKGPADVS